jgi:hypothetical protein
VKPGRSEVLLHEQAGIDAIVVVAADAGLQRPSASNLEVMIARAAAERFDRKAEGILKALIDNNKRRSLSRTTSSISRWTTTSTVPSPRAPA